MAIKYKYAYSSNELIGINSLTKETHEKSIKYECISCGRELIPKLGQKMQKHFAHKNVGDCSEETYLHKLGKDLFYQEFMFCLNNNKPFKIQYYEHRWCNTYEALLGKKCDLGLSKVDIDLTKLFNHCQQEKKSGSFIADILLSNDRGDELFVEIAVTHKLSEEKKQSEHKIIELSVASQDDLEPIKEHNFDVEDAKLDFVNFVPREVSKSFCSTTCSIHYDCFILFNTGSTSFKEYYTLGDITEFIKRFKNGIAYFDIYDTDEESYSYGRYTAWMGKQYFDKKNIKNCLLCRYHGDVNDKRGVFCKFQKFGCFHTNAAKCDYYRVEEKYAKELYDNWIYINKEKTREKSMTLEEAKKTFMSIYDL